MNGPTLKRALLVRIDRFGREYLSTPEDRRQFGETILCFILTGALIVATGIVLLAL